ncbi:MAG: hypothetical protein AAF989_16680 [Planctomycetota bacterium]
MGDGLSCNWTIHPQYFRDDAPILEFVHVVSYWYRVSLFCCDGGDEYSTTSSR